MSTNRLQNTLGYSPVLGGLRFLPLFLASFAVHLLTGRLIGKVAMRVLLGVAMAAAAAGPASIAHLPATWRVLLPGHVLAGIGLGVTSTALASATLAAVEPARAGMAAGLTNTMHLIGTATGVAVLGALYASRVNTATLHARAGLPAVPPDAVHRLAAAVASGAGTRVPDMVPPAVRAAVTLAGTASGLRRPARRGRVRHAGRDGCLRLRPRPSQTATAQPRRRTPARSGRPTDARPTTTQGENMTKIHFNQKTTLTPAQYVAGLTDFGPGRSKVFSNSADDYLKVHHVGTHEADVTEGSGGVWERLDYDWSDPDRVVLTTTDSTSRRSRRTSARTWSSAVPPRARSRCCPGTGR